MKLFPCSLGGPHQFKLIDNMSVRALFLAFEAVRNINLSSAVSTQRAEKVKAPYTIIYICSRRQSKIDSYFFRENKTWHFIRIVCQAERLLKPVSL